MAAESRRKNASLEQLLLQEPFRFDFFQAVRLLERLDEGRAPVGRDTRPGREAVRFVATLGLSFPASSIHDLRPAVFDRDLAPPDTPIMTVAFMGLTGPMGVLPTFYTEKLIGSSSGAGGSAQQHLSARGIFGPIQPPVNFALLPCLGQVPPVLRMGRDRASR